MAKEILTAHLFFCVGGPSPAISRHYLVAHLESSGRNEQDVKGGLSQRLTTFTRLQKAPAKKAIDMESSSQLRARMLERIRASLNHPATASAPAGLPRFLSRTPAVNVEGLIEKFIAETEKVGGHVARVNSGAEVREYIERLLLLNAAASVAVSNGQLVQEICIREWLLSRNTRVVSCLEEVAENVKTTSDSQFRHEPTGELTSMEQYKRVLLECGIGVTSANYALADTGTLVLLSGGEQHRLISLLPPVHVCILEPARILPGLSQLLTHVRKEFYSRERPPQALTCITGPSRTADIEQTITTGVHGPKSLHVLIYSPARETDF